jgi:Carboxylesterase family
MKRFLLLIFALTAFIAPSRAQSPTVLDTTGGRYYQPIFSQVTVRTATFGQAVNVLGQTQVLQLDFYEPTGDTVQRRPLIVFAHEGGFVGGTRTDAYAVSFAQRFARLGYCVASIDYRLLFFPFTDTVALGGAGFRAMQDMRGAIRFLRADALGTNQYHIAPDFIVAAGSSAGAVTALNVEAFDDPSEIPAFLAPLNLGTLEGTSGPAGFSSDVQAVVALCGGLNRVSWLTSGDAPLCLVHGTSDATVPYGRGTAGSGLPPLRVYGSGVIAPRATTLGIPNVLRTLRGAAHVPYNGTSARTLAYADTTFRTVRDFLRPLLPAANPLGVQAGMLTPADAAWPVPARTAVWLRTTANTPFQPQEATLIDAATGRTVRRFRWAQPQQQLERGALPAGTYLVCVPNRPALRVVFAE